MPTFSTLTIDFANYWDEGDELKIGVWDNNTSSYVFNEKWTWVTTRSSSYEVTTPATTGVAFTDSIAVANNFKAAFDLDFTTGYVTVVQNDNEVLIQSETEGHDFVLFSVNANNVGDATATFNNYEETPSASNVDLGLVRSPYYITTPFFADTTTAINIDLFIWDGDITSVPATATESITKTRPTVNYAEFNTDISDVIRANINERPVYDITPNVQLIDNNNVKWVRYVASYTDSVETISDVVGTFSSVEGYGYYSEGVNPQKPSDLVLSDCNNRRADRTSFIILPFINDGTITSIDVSTENDEINTTLNPVASVQSTDFIQYVSVNLPATTSDNTLSITFQPTGDTYVFNIEDECRYEPVNVVFKNKYGMYENVFFFKKRVDSITTESEMFVNNYLTAGSYDTTRHQYQKTNIQAKEKVTLNSGYIREDENELYKQLLLSDSVFFYDNGYIPVNVSSSSLDFKTRVNDKLTNYTIEFDYAYNTIQNV